MICYVVTACLKFLAFGLIFNKQAYFRKKFNIFDFVLLVLYILYIYIPNWIDPSPLRLIQLLIYFGNLFEGLNVMLTALREGFKFLFEGIMIVVFFSVFMAAMSQHLFHSLFKNQCFHSESGILTIEYFECGYTPCPDHYQCFRSLDYPNKPTNFDTIDFSYAQIMRTITMDDWTYVMYFTMRTFHP